MANLAGRLILLLAMLMMPLGMTGAVAAPNASAAVDMMAGHCPDQQREHDKGGIADCTMACAAALPAANCMADAARIRPVTLIETVQPHRLHGLHPETATPPPRAS